MAFYYKVWVVAICQVELMRIVARVIIFERVERSQKAKVEVSFHQQTQQIDYFLNCLYLIETICCSGSCVYVQVVVHLVCMFMVTAQLLLLYCYDSSHQLITAREMCSMVEIEVEYGK